MNAKDNLGKTPLIIAVEEKLPGIVKILLEAEENLDHVDINEYDNHMRSVLIHAILQENTDVLDLLFDDHETMRV